MINSETIGWKHRQLSSEERFHDALMPQLGTALSRSSMVELLNSDKSLHDSGMTALSAELVYVRYKPPRYCHVFYELELNDRSSGKTKHALVGAKLFSKPMSAGYVCRRTGFMRGKNGLPAFLHVQSLNAVLTFFPNDLKLPKLHSLFVTRDLRAALKTAGVHSSCLADEHPLTEIVSYRPERYCFVRVKPSPTTGDDTEPVFCRMLKTSEEAKTLHEGMESLWHSRANHGLRIAEPLGWDASSGTAFQSNVPGQTLTGQLNRESLFDSMEEAAETLSRIHSADVAAAPMLDEEEELRSFRSVVDALQRVAPYRFSKARTLFHQLRNHRPSSQASIGFVHGDYSSNQLLAHRDGMGVIDFGSCGIGDSNRDVANFVVRMANHLSGDLLNDAQRAFVHAYQRLSPKGFDSRAFAWQCARAYFKEGLTAFRKMNHQWLSRTDRCFGRAAEVLSSMTSGGGNDG